MDPNDAKVQIVLKTTAHTLALGQPAQLVKGLEKEVTHMAVIDRLERLGATRYTHPMTRAEMTKDLLEGRCLVVARCLCGQCEEPFEFVSLPKCSKPQPPKT